MVQNGAKWCKMVQNGTKWSPEVPNCPTMFKKYPIWSKMVQNCPIMSKTSKIFKNCPKLFKMVKRFFFFYLEGYGLDLCPFLIINISDVLHRPELDPLCP